MNREKHIDWPVLSRRAGERLGVPCAMHPFRSHLAPDVVAAYLESYTEAADVVLDPFCGSGVVAVEALRLGRRVIAADVDPAATFVTKATLAPVSLYHLDCVFEDVLAALEDATAECAGDPFSQENLTRLALDIGEKVEDPICRDLCKIALASVLQQWSKMRESRARRQVDPGKLLRRALKSVYEGKKEANTALRDATLTEDAADFLSGKANVLLLPGPAEQTVGAAIPPGSVDYLLTDPPYDLPLESRKPLPWWKAWLGQPSCNHGRATIAAGQAGAEDQSRHVAADVLRGAAAALKAGAYAHFFFHDVPGPAFHALLGSLPQVGYAPRKVVYQPPSRAPGFAAAKSREYAGGYIVRAELADGAVRSRISPQKLRRTIAGLARTTLEIRGGKAPLGSVWHAVYQGLDQEAIEAFAEQDAREFLKVTVAGFARIRGQRLTLLDSPESKDRATGLRDRITDALLDAYAMLPDGPDTASRAWQLVFRRLEGQPVTFDDVRAIDRTLTGDRKTKHRRRRYRELLRRVGEVLGFRPRRRESSTDRLTWEKDGKTVCQFGRLGSEEMTVRVPHEDGSLQRAREWGVIECEDLEQVLRNWTHGNKALRRLIGQQLNPVDVGDHGGGPAEHPGVADAATVRWRVLSNEEVCPDHRVMELEVTEDSVGRIKPGQFFHVLCDRAGRSGRRGSHVGAEDPLTLRRPLSVHRFHYDGFDRRLLARPSPLPPELRDKVKRRISQVDFLYRVVGAGTRRLAEFRKGDRLDVLGPIGRGFSAGTQRRAVIVAGGVGIAPLAALAEWLRYLDVKLRVYLGALREEYLWMAVRRPDAALYRGSTGNSREFVRLIRDQFAEIGVDKVVVCTDDGSVGRKGRVTDVLAQDLDAGRLWRTDVRFYACGPTPMMAGASKIARRLGAPCEVLLEERMGCGVGACYSCVCKVRQSDGETKMKRVCVDGPVFDGANVSWQS